MNTEYGIVKTDKSGRCYFYLNKFSPRGYEEKVSFADDINADMIEDMRKVSQDIFDFFDGYISFLESYITIRKSFLPFVEDFLHYKNGFLTPNEAAHAFDRINNENENAFLKIKCKMESLGYKVLMDENNNPILCKEIHFANLQSFIFYDFWKGVNKNFIPNKCKHCGTFFLIRAGKYFNYCDKPLADDPDKTCRDVGARQRYDDIMMINVKMIPFGKHTTGRTKLITLAI